MIAYVTHGRAGSPLPAAYRNAIHGAHGVTRPTTDEVIGARLWSQIQPQQVEIAARAAAGASHTAALRCILRKKTVDA
jgi:hypothetical protein